MNDCDAFVIYLNNRPKLMNSIIELSVNSIPNGL
jgi:hypothetical protein